MNIMQFSLLPSAETNEIRLAYARMRYAIGVLAILLPIILAVGASLVGDCSFPLPSVSHYYFSRMGDVFVSALSIIAFFLALYNPDNTQNWLTNIIAICLLLVAFFPTNYSPSDLGTCGVVGMPANFIRGMVHYSAATIAFFLLAYMAYFRFPQPKLPAFVNVLFKSQALFMVAIMLILGASKLLKFPENWNLTYWAETVLLLIFGNLWLMKGYHGDK
jgi:hypothetical protein